MFGIKFNYLVDNTAYYFPRELFRVHLQGHGVLYDIGTFIAVFLTHDFTFEMFHLARGLFALFDFILIATIVTRLVNKRAGFIAMVLLLVFPRFYGDMFINSLDMPVVFFLTCSIGFFLYLLKTKRTMPKLIIFGLLLGITVNQRLLMGYFVVITLFFLGIYDRYIKKKLLSQSIRQISVIALLSLFFMTVTHPWLITHPVTGIFDFIQAAKQYPWNATVLFEGQFINANSLPWYYLPKSMLITIPLFEIVLFSIGLIYIIIFLYKKNGQIEKKILYTYLLAVFFIPIGLAAILRPVLYDSWRHFLFLTIPLVCIVTIGFDYLLNSKHKYIVVSVVILVTINVFITGREMAILHPYEYIYYNSLVGGLPGAYTKYETDYWGEGYKEAVEWFNIYENNHEKKYLIFSEGDRLSAEYYFKDNMTFTGNQNNADYIFTFTRWDFHKKHVGTTIHTIERHGVPLIFIKKINNSL